MVDWSFYYASVTSGAHWFEGCSNLVEVDGFGYLTAMTDGSSMFVSCGRLESIYVTGGYESTFTSGASMFYGCIRLVGGIDGFVPTNSSNYSVCKLGAGGVLTDRYSDNREWCRTFLYDDGVLEITAAEAADAGRSVVDEGRLCVNAEYNGIGVLHCFGEHKAEVQEVVFKEDMGGYGDVNLNFWFHSLTALGSVVGLGNLTGVHEMEYTFAGCEGLVELDFSGFDPSGLTSLFNTFANCSNLTTIFADADWKLPEQGLTGMNCFYGCKALQGGAGTMFDTSRTAYSYMVIDSADTPGFLTVKE